MVTLRAREDTLTRHRRRAGADRLGWRKQPHRFYPAHLEQSEQSSTAARPSSQVSSPPPTSFPPCPNSPFCRNSRVPTHSLRPNGRVSIGYVDCRHGDKCRGAPRSNSGATAALAGAHGAARRASNACPPEERACGAHIHSGFSRAQQRQ